MATIKYKDENGKLVTVGAGLHTHLPSDIGAAAANHPHDVATDSNDGFLSSEDKIKIDNATDHIFGNHSKNIQGLIDLVGGKPVSEEISAAIVTATTTIGDAANKYTDEQIAEALTGTVPTTRTVNGKALGSDISLTASDIGAAASGHTHDSRYYTENEIDIKLSDLVGESPVSEQISTHASNMASASTSGHMSAEDKSNLNSVIAQLGGYTIQYNATSSSLPSDTKIITLVPRGQ